MPLVETAVLDIPVLWAETVPAAKEIGQEDVIRFAPEANAHQLADLGLKRMEHSSVFQLRKRVRQNPTWDSIFRQELIPLLNGGLS